MAKIITIIELDTPAFEPSSPGEKTWRFCEPTDYFPREIEAIPSIISVDHQAAIISLGKDLGQRASLTVRFRDHRHVMAGEPFHQGTFWGKFRARYGQKLRGCPIRLIRGRAGQAVSEMETRHFFVEKVDGPTPDGVYTIEAKDLLKFCDHDRAQAPRLSNGRLAGSIDDDDTTAILSPEGIGDLEYPQSGYVCIAGKEICAFTRSGDVLSLTRGQLGTQAGPHEIGDRVQLVLYYPGDDVADIIADLMINYAGIPAEYIPINDWKAETSAHLSVIYARAITEPTAVNKLVSELIEQAALAVWWDDLARLVRLQVLRQIATDAQVFDEDQILEGTLQVRDQPEKRISQIWTYYGQRNPTDRGDHEDNYRAALATVDLQRESEYGGPEIRKIMGRWIQTLSAAERLNQIQISRFRDPPRRFNFSLLQGTPVLAGGGYRLRWRQNQDIAGNVIEEGAPIQITRVSFEPGVIHIEAEEMLASGVIVLTHTVILTATGGVFEWEVPNNWNSDDNIIECIGAGGAGGYGIVRHGATGGGGGAYSAEKNVLLTPGQKISYSVGEGGISTPEPGGRGGDTWFGAPTFAMAIVAARGGENGYTPSGPFDGPSGGLGGQAVDGIGSIRFSGGNGGRGSRRESGERHAGGGGGGGAAGPHGDGAHGGNAGGSGSRASGGGGGGADGGGNGGHGSGNTGGNGGPNRIGIGGGTPNIPDGWEGGGGKGADRDEEGFRGGSGQQLWTQTIAPIFSAGPGGGGGGAGTSWDKLRRGGQGGLYGGGGGGGGGGSGVDDNLTAPRGPGGNGAQGMIAITWRPEQ